GHRLALLDDGILRLQDRAAFRIQRPRTAGAAAGRNRIRVALANADAVEVDAKLLGDDLAVGGLVTLARRLRADLDVDEAVFGEADFRALGRRAAGRLEIIGHADAAALATLAGLGPARREAGPVDRLQRGIRRVLELAGIVGQAHGAGPWEGVGR